MKNIRTWDGQGLQDDHLELFKELKDLRIECNKIFHSHTEDGINSAEKVKRFDKYCSRWADYNDKLDHFNSLVDEIHRVF